MMTFFLIFFLLVLILPDLYIWGTFVRGVVGTGWAVAYWAPTVLAFLALGCWLGGVWPEGSVRLFFGLLMCISAPKAVFAFCSLAGRGVGVVVPAAVRIGTVLGIIAAVGVCGMFYYGFSRGWKRLTVQETTLCSDRLPAAFDGYRIVHLSDLHVGTYGNNTAYLARLVERVNALRPDMIVFTGDLVNASPEELDPFGETLARLRAPDGVYAVLGNHDYCVYMRYDSPDGAARNTLELIRREREVLGWDLLLNEHRIVRRGEDSLAVVGVENDGKSPFVSRGDLSRALHGLPDGVFTILLSHDPSHWRREVLPASDIPVTLSGHTHAMQLRLGGFSPARWAYSEWGGLYRDSTGRQLYVSEGVGGSVPFRLGAWPAIDLLMLCRPAAEREAGGVDLPVRGIAPFRTAKRPFRTLAGEKL